VFAARLAVQPFRLISLGPGRISKVVSRSKSGIAFITSDADVTLGQSQGLPTRRRREKLLVNNGIKSSSSFGEKLVDEASQRRIPNAFKRKVLTDYAFIIRLQSGTSKGGKRKNFSTRLRLSNPAAVEEEKQQR
jgi:hypothetical protein